MLIIQQPEALPHRTTRATGSYIPTRSCSISFRALTKLGCNGSMDVKAERSSEKILRVRCPIARMRSRPSPQTHWSTIEPRIAQLKIPKVKPAWSWEQVIRLFLLLTIPDQTPEGQSILPAL